MNTNNKRVEILTEELSMSVFLKGFLPRILPEGFELDKNCFLYHHQGKSDLQKKLPNRVKAYKYYPNEVLLLVVHDQDSNDCIKLKQKLVNLIEKENSDLKFIVRIACRELENWYLGDLKAVEQLYPKSKASKQAQRAKFRNPDKVTGAYEMGQFSKEFGKVSCARRIAPILNIQNNKSTSFNQFVSGLQKLLTEISS